MEFHIRLENRFRAESSTGAVPGEQGLEFAGNLLGGSFWDQGAFDLQLEALL